jgi:2-polyprenyl-6-methoxyphenol hydroxylase-like FAD-dependent oxidoreductase
LAAALSASRAGWDVRLFERANAFSEVGAGIQLGPNVVKVLQGWGLSGALQIVAAFPERLQVRSALSGQTLGELPLGATIAERYGAPYATLHRADLHRLLLEAVQQHADVKLHLSRPLQSFSQTAQAVMVQADDGPGIEGDALIGADGVWSMVRQQLLGDGLPRRTGHLAYRALVRQADLPKLLRSQHVTAWLGPRMHVVQYPVRGGEWLNVVAIVQGEVAAEADLWDHSANAADLAAATAGCSPRCAKCSTPSKAGACGCCTTARPCKAPTSTPWAAWPYWAMPPTRCAPTSRKAPAWRLKTPPNWATPWPRRWTRPLMCPPCCSAMRSTAGSAMRGCRRGLCAMGRSFMPMGWCGGGGMCP